MKKLTVNQCNSDQTGQRSNLVAAVDVLKDGTRFPLILSSDSRKINFMSGLKYSGTDYYNWTRSKTRVTVNGLALKYDTPPAFFSEGEAYICTDLGYEAPLQSIFFGSYSWPTTALTVYIGTADSMAAAIALGVGDMTAVTSGQDLSGIALGRYLKIYAYFTSNPAQNRTSTLYNLELTFNYVKQIPWVIDWGTHSAKISGGTGQVSWPSYDITLLNIGGCFTEQMATYNIIGQPIYVFKYPDNALPTDFEQIYTGIVDDVEFNADRATIKASKTRYHLMQMFPRLKASDFGRVEAGGTYLPAPIGHMDVTEKATDPVATTAEEQCEINATARAFSGASGGTWKFTYRTEDISGVDTPVFDVYYKGDLIEYVRVSRGSYTCEVGGHDDAYTSWTINRQSLLTQGDGFSFSVLVGGGITAVRIDPGMDTTDEDQVWAIAQWPCYGDLTLYVNSSLVSSSDYDHYYGNTYKDKPYKICYVKLNKTDLGLGAGEAITSVTAGVSGLIYNGDLAENPVDIARAILTWSAMGEYLIWNDYIDEDSFHSAKAFFRGRGIVLSGEIPAAQMTVTEIIARLFQFQADVDVSEGIIRIIPVESTIAEDTEVFDELNWFRVTGGVKYRYVPDIQNRLRISYGKYIPKVSDSEQIVELEDTRSVSEYGRIWGHAASEAVGISLPYIPDADTTKLIGQTWLDLHKEPYLEITCTIPGLEKTNIQIGDKHLVLTDDIFPNRTSHNLGVTRAVMQVIGFNRRLQTEEVSITARIYQVNAVEEPPTPWHPPSAVLIWDEGSWDDGFYMG